MNLLDVFRRHTFQRKSIDEQERVRRVRSLVMELASEGEKMEGILAIFIKDGVIYVTEGGLQDDFEAQVLMQRAIYLINRDGLVTQ